MGPIGLSTLVLLGLASAVFVLVALSAAFVLQLRAHWARTAVRVAGSWVAACGLLMMAGPSEIDNQKIGPLVGLLNPAFRGIVGHPEVAGPRFPVGARSTTK
jgi:hypothetical protein